MEKSLRLIVLDGARDAPVSTPKWDPPGAHMGSKLGPSWDCQWVRAETHMGEPKWGLCGLTHAYISLH
jgi:hypothetical protein